MRVASNFRWFRVAAAMVAVTWTGCASMSGITPFNLASHRAQSAPNVTTPAQLATTERADSSPADGFQTQFVSAPATRPQPRYPTPSCTSGFG